MESALLIDRNQIIREPLGLERARTLPQENLEGDAVRSVECVWIDPPGGCQVALIEVVLLRALLGPDAVRQVARSGLSSSSSSK